MNYPLGNFSQERGTVHTQDAPVGSTIGLVKYTRFPVINCTTTVPFSIQANMLGAKLPSVAAAIGSVQGSQLYSTNIPGIGVGVVNESRPSYLCLTSGSSYFPLTFTGCNTEGFNITLNNCVAGTYAGNPTWNYFRGNNANIRLDGAKGSTIVDAGQGVLGLNSEATATGVAVQVLKQDGTPLPLGVDVPIMPVQDGTTTLQFGARYIQTAGDSTGPQPGIANATANFTITYK